MKRSTRIAGIVAASVTLFSGISIGVSVAAPSAQTCQVTSTPTVQRQNPTVRKDATKSVQCLLNKQGAKLQVDGYFGAKTQAAVIAFQKKKGLYPDGIVGPKTWAALTGKQVSKPQPSTNTSGARAKALAYARAQLGKPYVWGAEGPNSFDCSGLTMRAMQAAGKSVPRTASQQQRAGVRISMSELQPGDLVTFGSPAYHIGIYTGDGKIIHAPRPGKVVEEVKIWGGASGGVRFL